MRRSFKCPVCHFTQNNRRLPDLDRHIRTHYRDELNQPKCKGVPLARAAEFGLDPADAKPGATHIGGCWMTFARLDALKRHLHNPNTNCVGIA
ncbi:hypothetical protein OF83DRAFT_1049320 [Amylostereum chailletii]|nr:hypothetical protein OF83DRAFT_1049320 [Amylostereum chailletii]